MVRSSVLPGDFFAPVPETDIYLLKHILHDWNDEEAGRILKGCREAMRPGGRVIVISVGYVLSGEVTHASVKERMKEILNKIQNGEFAKGWIGEYKNGLPTYQALLEQSKNHPIEEVGVRLRSLMPWVQKKNITGAQAAY